MPNPMIQKRIANPYMPQGTADKTNAATPVYAPGELGGVFQEGGNTYQRVLLDSGATSTNAVGAVAANQLAFWKDQSKFIVTNDKKQAVTPGNGASNTVAGVFRAAVSTAAGTKDVNGNPVQYMCDVLIYGTAIPVASDGSGAAGDLAIADTTASVARVTNVTAGTAPTYLPVGVIRAAAAGGNISVDVSLGSFE